MTHERGVLVGATFVGPEVAELLHAATVAIVAEVPLAKLAHAVPSFPTRSELWLKLVEAYEDQHGVTLHATAERHGQGQLERRGDSGERPDAATIA